MTNHEDETPERNAEGTDLMYQADELITELGELRDAGVDAARRALERFDATIGGLVAPEEQLAILRSGLEDARREAGAATRGATVHDLVDARLFNPRRPIEVEDEKPRPATAADWKRFASSSAPKASAPMVTVKRSDLLREMLNAAGQAAALRGMLASGQPLMRSVAGIVRRASDAEAKSDLEGLERRAVELFDELVLSAIEPVLLDTLAGTMAREVVEELRVGEAEGVKKRAPVDGAGPSSPATTEEEV